MKRPTTTIDRKSDCEERGDHPTIREEIDRQETRECLGKNLPVTMTLCNALQNKGYSQIDAQDPSGTGRSEQGHL